MFSILSIVFVACNNSYFSEHDITNLSTIESKLERTFEFEPLTAVESTYNTFFIDSSYLLNPLDVPWAEHFSFSIIQADNMNDNELQRKINMSIIEAMTHWIEETYYSEGTVYLIPSIHNNPMIHLQSERFLSFSNHFDLLNPNRGDSVIDVITIDMSTGERVMLNDLVDVCIEFAERLSIMGVLPRWMEILDADNLLEELQLASLYNDELGNWGSDIMIRTSFHIEENRLIINRHSQGRLTIDELCNQVIINLCDIVDYLLVEEW